MINFNLNSSRTGVKVYKVAVFLFVLLICLEVTGMVWGKWRPSDYIYYWTLYNEDKSVLESTYSMNIDFDVAEDNYPKNWLQNIPDTKNFTTISSGPRRAQMLVLLSSEFKKYPVNIVKENINTLYLLGVLKPYGGEVGGFYDGSKNSIFISTRSEAQSRYAPDDFIEETIHHEFSSILMERYGFSEAVWRSAAQAGFQYEQDKDPMYRWLFLNHYIKPADESVVRPRGIIRAYGETGVENDFNIYAETIFTDPYKMKQLIEEYPIIKRKYEVFKQFYLSIDAGFAPVFEKIDT